MAKKYSMSYGKDDVDVLVSKRRKPARGTALRDKFVAPSGDESVVRIEITPKSIITVLFVIAGIYLAAKLLPVILLIFFAFVISSAVLPAVRGLVKKGVPRGFAAAFVYLASIFVFVGLAVLVFVPFVSEMKDFASDSPKLVKEFIEDLDGLRFGPFQVESEGITNSLNDLVKDFSDQISFSRGLESVYSTLGTISGVAGQLFSAFTVLVISIYIVVDHDTFLDLFLLS